MFNILNLIPGKIKKTASKWHTFNSVCCHHRGHKPDKRMRGGIIFSNDTNFTVNCFNCHFKCRFELGKAITGHTRKFLYWCGVDESQIDKWSLESLSKRDLVDVVKKKKKQIKEIIHPPSKLPKGAELITVGNPKHATYVKYLSIRGFTDLVINEFYCTPSDEIERNRNRIIIPCTDKNVIVGTNSRYLDKSTPKYIKEIPPDYLFGYDKQSPRWQVCIVTEGTFDALCIDGVALQHNSISETQADMLRALERRIIVVPDQDDAGLEMCDQILEMGFQVSLPKWGSKVKDINDAVIKYGKVPTLLSILQYASHSKIKTEMAIRRIKNGLNN